MPTVLYDAEGNEKQVPTEDEIKAMVSEKETELTTVKEKLAKLENKEFNFKRLKDMTDAEKEKLSGIELDLKQKQEKLEEDQKAFIEDQVKERKEYAFTSLAGDDKDLRAKLEFHFKRLDPDKPATTQEAIMARAREAYTLATGNSVQTRSQLSGAMGLQGTGMKAKAQNDITADPEAMELAAKMGVSKEDIEKYSK